MTIDEAGVLEHRLRALYEVPVPPSLDARMQAVIAARSALRPDPIRRRAGGRRPLIAVLAAAILVTVAASPLAQLFGGWGTDFDRVFALSTPVDQSVTVDGYRVTLVRAYLDTDILRLTVAGEDVQGRDISAITVDDARVTDANGVTYPASLVISQPPDAHTSETLWEYLVPAEASTPGTRRMTVLVPGLRVLPTDASPVPGGGPGWVRVPGPFTFAFDLGLIPARSVAPMVTATASDVIVTFEDLTVTPATTTARLHIDGLPARPTDWAWDPYIRMEHDGKVLDIDMLSPGSVNDALVLGAVPGFDDLAGTWTITIDQFHRDIPDPSSDVTTEVESVVGPWVLTYTGR